MESFNQPTNSLDLLTGESRFGLGDERVGRDLEQGILPTAPVEVRNLSAVGRLRMIRKWLSPS
ncbi:hypothetical protein ACWDV4_29940 [Micromonospora sp. NPDC003197]